MRIGICSDLHSHRQEHSDDIRALIQHINAQSDLDALIFAGDLSHRTHELKAFLGSITLACPKLWVPGNHDIWVVEKETEQDTSDYRYRKLFAQISESIGWHYLPTAQYIFESSNLAIVGTIGWFSGEGYSEWYGVHADERNEQLALQIAADLEKQLQFIGNGLSVVLVLHHVPHSACIEGDLRSKGRVNKYIQQVLEKTEAKIDLVIHGHCHVRYEKKEIDGIRYLAHPFGYPYQHASIFDGFTTITLK